MKSKLLDQMRESLRLAHYSHRTEQSYIGWVQRFILFHNKKHPAEMGTREIGAFLSHLANDLHVAASTQNVALQAILYLYKHVLKIQIGNIDFARARREKRLPIALTKAEVKQIISAIPDAEYRLMAEMIYGGGVRLMECLRLRIKDVDMENQRLTIRDTKSNCDRFTILPSRVVERLRRHIAVVEKIHQSDIAAGIGIYLPNALATKYPNAQQEVGWRWVFPSRSISIDPHSGKPARHHVHESGLQKIFHDAVKRSKLAKPASVHMLRHSFATHFLEGGGNVVTLQQLLGHKDLQTTMIYVHTVEISGKRIKSPLDD